MTRGFAVGLLLAAVAAAQPKAQISGFIFDATSAVLADASVAVLNLDTGVRRSTKTSNEGFYAVSSLTPGEYKITVRKPGFQTLVRTGIQLHALDSARLDLTLDVGTIYDEITVKGDAPLRNISDASYGMQMRGREGAESLPLNGRGLQALVDLAPGVLTTPATAGEAGQFSSNGQRPATNYFTVDGVSANNGVSGTGLPGQFPGGALPAMTAIGSLHNLVSLGDLDELRVQTSTFAPEHGRLPGAQIAVSTRSGSNTFGGELMGSFRHEKLAAGTEGLRLRLLNAAGSLSGPLRRNSTFFSLSSEYLRLRQPASFLLAVPPLAVRGNSPVLNAYPVDERVAMVTPSDLSSTSGRIDQALRSRGIGFVRVNRTPSSNRFGFLQSNEAKLESQTVTAGVAVAASARITNDTRLGFSRTTAHSRWLPGASNLDLRTMLPTPGEGQKLYGIGIRGYAPFLTADEGRSEQGLWNLTDTLSFTAGRHDLRFGADYQRLTPERDQPIASITAVYDRVEDLALPRIPAYTYAQTGGGASLIETLSLFAQDTWHMTPRLNVTYGSRWEMTPPPSYRRASLAPTQTTGLGPVPPRPAPPQGASEQPVWNTRYTQVAPRIGAAYRLDESATFVLRAGAGIFYDLGFSSAVDLVNGAPFNRFRSAFSLVSLPGDAVQYGFAPDMKLPYAVHWNVAIERALGTDAAVSIAYVGSRGERLLRREGQLEPNLLRPTLVLATNHGASSFHSMQAHYRSRNFRGLHGTISYTWSHAIDNGSWDSATWLLFPGTDAFSDRGSANFDVRHSFQAALGYELARTGLRAARGWTLSGAFRARTGFPVDVVTSEHPFGLGFENEFRPDVISGQPLWIGGRLNRAAFAAPPAGRQGNLGRNAIRGFGLAQVDLALERSVVLSERGRALFRAEVYNLTNRVNLADPVRVLASPLFGRSPSLANLMLGSGRPNSGLTPAFQSGGPRVVQVGLTLRF